MFSDSKESRPRGPGFGSPLKGNGLEKPKMEEWSDGVADFAIVIYGYDG